MIKDYNQANREQFLFRNFLNAELRHVQIFLLLGVLFGSVYIGFYFVINQPLREINHCSKFSLSM